MSKDMNYTILTASDIYRSRAATMCRSGIVFAYTRGREAVNYYVSVQETTYHSVKPERKYKTSSKKPGRIKRKISVQSVLPTNLPTYATLAPFSSQFVRNQLSVNTRSSNLTRLFTIRVEERGDPGHVSIWNIGQRQGTYAIIT